MSHSRARGVSLRVVVLFVLAFTFSIPGFSAEHIDLYSESTVQGREELLAFSLKVRNDADPFSRTFLHPYVQAGTELQTRGLGNYNVSDTSFAYFGAGLKFPIKDFVLRPEVWVRAPVNPGPTTVFPYFDGRILLAYWNWFETEAGMGVLTGFIEPYSETLFTTADENNVIHSTQVKFGVRFPVAARTTVDLLTEPYVIVDRVGHFWNNRADLKLGTRFSQRVGDVSLSLLLTAVANKYFRNEDPGINPYDNRTLSFRALLVVAGYF